MKKRVFFIIIFIATIALLYNCAIVEKKGNTEDDYTLPKLVHNHFQELKIEDLKKIFEEESLNSEEKSFIAYYILTYLDDPNLIKYVNQNVKIPISDGINNLLFQLRKISESDTLNQKKIHNKIKLAEPDNLYFLIEQYYSDTTVKNKLLYLNKAIQLYSENDIIATMRISEDKYGGDSLSYFKHLGELKKNYDNYYVYLFIGNEYANQYKIDSAIFYYKKSLDRKKTIGAYLQLSQVSFNQGQYNNANSYLDEAQKIDLNNEEVITLKAWHYFDLKNSIKAKENFEKLIKHYPVVKNYKELLLYYLCLDNKKKVNEVYKNYIRDSISKSEQAAYFLVFEILKKKNQEVLHNKIDSIEKVHGLTPIDYSNQIIETILRSRNN